MTFCPVFCIFVTHFRKCKEFPHFFGYLGKMEKTLKKKIEHNNHKNPYAHNGTVGVLPIHLTIQKTNGYTTQNHQIQKDNKKIDHRKKAYNVKGGFDSIKKASLNI